jgi:hypothetical protein
MGTTRMGEAPSRGLPVTSYLVYFRHKFVLANVQVKIPVQRQLRSTLGHTLASVIRTRMLRG